MSSSIQDLKNKFNSKLTEYKEIYDRYVNLLNANDKSFMQLPDSSFIGEHNLKVLANSTISDCQSSCISNTTCTGATFISPSNDCTLSSGEGSIIPANNMTAITYQVLYYKKRLGELNTEMTDLNQQIMVLFKNTDEQSLQTNANIEEQENILIQNNEILLKDRSEIKKMSREFQTLNAAYNDKTIILNANYSNYIVLLFVGIFLILLLMRYGISGPQSGGGVGGKVKQNITIYMILICILLFLIFILLVIITQQNNENQYQNESDSDEEEEDDEEEDDEEEEE